MICVHVQEFANQLQRGVKRWGRTDNDVELQKLLYYSGFSREQTYYSGVSPGERFV